MFINPYEHALRRPPPPAVRHPCLRSPSGAMLRAAAVKAALRGPGGERRTLRRRIAASRARAA